MTLVIDASAVAAALVGAEHGDWAERQLHAGGLTAPHLLPVEVTHVLRRAESSGAIDPSGAVTAVANLHRMTIALVAFAPFAKRVWELRSNVSVYDGAYVALAEALGVPLLTLDRRLVDAPGPRCGFITPGDA